MDELTKRAVENAEARLREMGLTKKELAVKIGVSSAALYSYFRGVRTLSPVVLEKIADFFKISVAELTKETEGTLDQLMVLADVPAGQPDLNFGIGERFVNVIGFDKSCFVMRVSGDSMVGGYAEECIPNGAYVLLTRRGITETESCIGKVVYASVDNGEYSLKQLRRMNGELMLFPWNPAYQPIHLTENSRILGVALGWFMKA